jgi:hypothetical protein
MLGTPKEKRTLPCDKVLFFQLVGSERFELSTYGLSSQETFVHLRLRVGLSMLY